MEAIKNYIIYLKTQYKLKVTVHPNAAVAGYFSRELMSFNIHDNPYCLALKSCPHAHRHCIEKQAAVCQKAANGAYCGVCHAGVLEFVYPIFYRGETVGFVSVGGYQCSNAAQYIRSVCEKYGLKRGELEKAYAQLNGVIPAKEALDVLLQPLCDMLELALIKADAPLVRHLSFPEQVEEYLRTHHTERINTNDLCKVFHYGRTYISTQFNRFYGKSIRRYLTELRISDAKNLLQHSSLSVAEIAFSVGFSDSNYFSDVFKKHTGLSPLTYKSTHNKNPLR